MSNWITHMIIAENILSKTAKLDITGFTAGNIAPDCNIENADWTAFTPPREKTHYMSGESKLTADYERFYREYIENGNFRDKMHFSFLAGYYAHLITDVEYQKFVRDEKRLERLYERLRENEEAREIFSGYPQTYDAVKEAFGRKKVYEDIFIIENRYINAHPDSFYNTVLRKITEFPDYLDFLPAGAVVRKIGVMTYEVPKNIPDIPLMFFPEEEYMAHITQTTDIVSSKLHEKNII